MTVFILIIVCLILLAQAVLIALLLRLIRNQGASGTDLDRPALTDCLRKEVSEPLLKADRDNQAALRGELSQELRQSREEAAAAAKDLGETLRTSQTETARRETEFLSAFAESLNRRMTDFTETQSQRMTDFSETQKQRVEELSQGLEKRQLAAAEAQKQQFEAQDRHQQSMQESVNALLAERMDHLNTSVNRRLEEVNTRFTEFREQSVAAQNETKQVLEERLNALQKDNADKLEQMRETVDEKLQNTLNERISQSFKAVNDRLAEVYKGLGEMQKLAGDVGDLKKVMSNVKNRGILGEIQLGALMEDMLAPGQYEENIMTKKGSGCRVEYAVRLPGTGDEPVYLPIDSKFPADAYRHVVDAYDSGDSDRIKTAVSELETRIKLSAKDIHDKYIDPPATTTFGILFLPFEGLYAEAVRLGLPDLLQREYQISLAGPTTLSALLNSLQMGFRTLAIQKRSDEVWQVLGAVKTEFGKFGEGLSNAQKKLEQTGKELDQLIGVRTRQINRRLNTVSELPSDAVGSILNSPDTDVSDETDV